jgi:hypothetical protein
MVMGRRTLARHRVAGNAGDGRGRRRDGEIVVTDGDRVGSIATSMVAADDEVEGVTEAIREVVARTDGSIPRITDGSIPRIAVRRPRIA